MTDPYTRRVAQIESYAWRLVLADLASTDDDSDTMEQIFNEITDRATLTQVADILASIVGAYARDGDYFPRLPRLTTRRRRKHTARIQAHLTKLLDIADGTFNES